MIHTNHLSIFFNPSIFNSHVLTRFLSPLSVQIHQALPQLVALRQQRAGRQRHGPGTRGPEALAVATAPGRRPVQNKAGDGEGPR